MIQRVSAQSKIFHVFIYFDCDDYGLQLIKTQSIVWNNDTAFVDELN